MNDDPTPPESFLNGPNSTPLDERTRKTEIPKNLRLPILLLLILVPTLSLYVLSKIDAFTYIKNNLPSKPKTPLISPTPSSSVVSPSPSETPSPSPTPIYLEKELLKVRIYNGTGVRGQAGKIGDALAGIGFKNIITANMIKRTDEAIVSYSKNVSPQVKDEVLKTLKDNFITVQTESIELTNGYDIEITTGR